MCTIQIGMLRNHMLLMRLMMLKWMFLQQLMFADFAEVFVRLDDSRHEPAADVGGHNVHDSEPHQHLVHINDDLWGT